MLFRSISWIRGHIGIPGNEKADALADEHRERNTILPPPLPSPYTRRPPEHITTPAGIRLRSRATRADSRKIPSFGQATNWHRQAASAYTWTRTNRGPLKEWLHHIGKADSPDCPTCPSERQSGHHVTFTCPALATESHLPPRTHHLGVPRLTDLHTRPPR